jgi:predicted P-loop ATPase
MTSNNSFLIRYSTGTGLNFGKAKNKYKSLRSFKNDFRKPVVTNEQMKDFLKLPDKDQAHLKSIGGWVYRTQVDGPVRNRGSGLPSDLVTLDFDYATPEFLLDLISGEIQTEWEWFLHTSRRHTSQKPRFRIFVFLSDPVPNDLYGPVSRIVAQNFDQDMVFVDKVSFRPAQMMFMPTISKDGEFVFHENSGELCDWSDVLDTFELTRGDWHDINNLPQVAGENARETLEKAEDPTEKAGPVGNFCRAYDVMQAIEAFDLPYTEADVVSGKQRYTYTGGTTTNGAEVQDDGLFLYSHHGSDPCSDMLVNAFDLVRIHKFGHEDEKFDPEGKPMSARPSWKLMLESLEHNEGYRKQQVLARYDAAAINDDFDDTMDPEDIEIDLDYDPEIDELVGSPEPQAKIIAIHRDDAADLGPRTQLRVKRADPPADWMNNLQVTKDGIIIANAPNLAQIVQNDKRTRNSVEYNEFTERVCSRRPLRTRMAYISDGHVVDPVNGDAWEDIHTMSVRTMIESENGPGKAGYGFKVSDRDMDAGIELAARQGRFHPVREYLESLPEQEISHAETLFIKYMGCPDTPYHREAAKLFLLGAVARVYEPGHKFDFVPILFGAQGKRKSTFIRILACDWHGELKATFSDENKLVEQMSGAWIMEMPELSSIGRSAIEDAKAFVTAVSSHVRLAWARRSKVYKRQCVFIGSTNDDEFLIDTTGNRRWWPIRVQIDMIDTDELHRCRAKIWGAAVAEYKRLRAAQPEGDLDLSLRDPDSIHESEDIQEETRVGTEVDHYAMVIQPYLDAKIRTHGKEDDFDMDARAMHHRHFVAISELWTEALEQNNRSLANDQRAIRKALKMCGWVAAKSPMHHPLYGKPVRVYLPGAEVRARWAEMEAKTANMEGDDLI